MKKNTKRAKLLIKSGLAVAIATIIVTAVVLTANFNNKHKSSQPGKTPEQSRTNSSQDVHTNSSKVYIGKTNIASTGQQPDTGKECQPSDETIQRIRNQRNGPNDELTIDEAITNDILANPGTGDFDVKTYTVIKTNKQQYIFIHVSNETHTPDNFTVTAEGNIVGGKQTATVHINGSCDYPLTYKVIGFTANSSLAVTPTDSANANSKGYELKVSVTGSTGITVGDSAYITVVDPSPAERIMMKTTLLTGSVSTDDIDEDTQQQLLRIL